MEEKNLKKKNIVKLMIQIVHLGSKLGNMWGGVKDF
ncbi:hypothetical protein CoNPh26_CDS0131 [Staphylococcus phage S-CoN_Ph26]|nr:hypothetical protein CoNPh26_CDS0131 [Staphylococcus phage S-CoN_Ph26]